jgi:uncharacterized membrane protein
MTRTETFVDAAFAFSVTLLVISVGSVPSDIDSLREAFKSVPAFAMSFAIIAVFWYQHHRWSRRFGLDDGVSVLLSLLLVFLVLVYVYPLRIMADSVMHVVSGGWLPAGLQLAAPGDLVFVYLVYGFGFAALSGVLWLLNLHAWRLRETLRLSVDERMHAQEELFATAFMSAMGLASALLALALPVERWPWLLALPGMLYNLLFLLPWLAPAHGRRYASTLEAKPLLPG